MLFSQEMERPPAQEYEQQWDATIDLTLRRFVYGSLSGAASALLFFRGPTTRWAAVAFGAGAGIGSAFTESSQMFRGAIHASLPSVVSSHSSTPAPLVSEHAPSAPPAPSAPEPEHFEAAKFDRFEEPLIQEAQET